MQVSDFITSVHGFLSLVHIASAPHSPVFVANYNKINKQFLNYQHFLTGQSVQVRPAMPQVVQFPMAAQTIPVQVPINTGNGQTIYQTVHVPIQNFGNQMPQIIQPQMQIIPQFTQQVANIITPSGHIQQVQLANVPMLQQPQAAAAAQQAQNMSTMQQTPMKVDSPAQEQVQTPQPITITNAQGQQMTVIPAQAMRPNQNANIIQIPNLPVPAQIQHIPGIGNVQVISANALNGNFMAQPIQTMQQIPQSPVVQTQPAVQQPQTVTSAATTPSTPASSHQTPQTQTITITPQAIKQVENETTPTKWIVKPDVSTPILLQASSASVTTSQSPAVTTHSQTTILPTITHVSTIPSTSSAKPIAAAPVSNQVTIQPAPAPISSASETKTTNSKTSMSISVTPASTQPTTVNQTSVNVNINVSSSDPSGSASTPDIKPRVRRVACTCPNCTMPERSTDRKKQHICHVAGCNKVYGKTSHLRAHLRWHTGMNGYC